MKIVPQYVLFSLAVTVPYLYLSGGGSVIIGAILLPPALFVAAFGMNFRGGSIVTSLVLSPIALNGVSLLCRIGGIEWAAGIIYEWRYAVVLVAGGFWLLYEARIFVEYFLEYWENRRKRHNRTSWASVSTQMF